MRWPDCPPRPPDPITVDLSDFQGYVRPAWWGRCPLVADVALPRPDRRDREVSTDLHVLVIEDTCEGDHDPYPCDEECVNYSVECPGVTDQCRMWETCIVKDCDANEHGWGYDGGDAHGIDHKLIDDQWMTWTDRCFVQCHDGFYEAASEVDGKPGRYFVDHDFGDGTELCLTLVREAA